MWFCAWIVFRLIHFELGLLRILPKIFHLPSVWLLREFREIKEILKIELQVGSNHYVKHGWMKLFLNKCTSEILVWKTWWTCCSCFGQRGINYHWVMNTSTSVVRPIEALKKIWVMIIYLLHIFYSLFISLFCFYSCKLKI